MKTFVELPKLADLLEVTIINRNRGSRRGGMVNLDDEYNQTPNKSKGTMNLSQVLFFQDKTSEFCEIDKEKLPAWKERQKAAYEKQKGMDDDEAFYMLDEDDDPRPLIITKVTGTYIETFPASRVFIEMPYEEFREIYRDFIERKELPID